MKTALLILAIVASSSSFAKSFDLGRAAGYEICVKGYVFLVVVSNSGGIELTQVKRSNGFPLKCNE